MDSGLSLNVQESQCPRESTSNKNDQDLKTCEEPKRLLDLLRYQHSQRPKSSRQELITKEQMQKVKLVRPGKHHQKRTSDA